MDILFSVPSVGSLKSVENQFLEVLVPEFTMIRHGTGVRLHVSFDDTVDTIWFTSAKNDVEQRIPDFKRRSLALQKELDEFLLNGVGSVFTHDKPDFPFRYASGGVLPIVRLGSKDYYCLFYRDIFPVGWNIANGGCDTRYELLNPLETLERELREELIAVNFEKERLCVFEEDEEKPLDRPEFGAARRFWRERFPHVKLEDFERRVIPLKWSRGPDSLSVEIKGYDRNLIENCFLNINGEDFGIEIDRVARMTLDEDITLLDGELGLRKLLGRPVGLFDVHRLNQTLEADEDQRDFRPDFFFYDGDRYKAESLEGVIERLFIPRIFERRGYVDTTAHEAAKQAGVQFDLCPVTRRILRRYLKSVGGDTPARKEKYDIFISYGREDTDLATTVCDYLEQRDFRLFLSHKSLSGGDIDEGILNALDSAQCLLAVTSKVEHIEKRWPMFEVRTFHHEMLDSRKAPNSMLSFFWDGDPRYLPLPLRVYQVVTRNAHTLEEGLAVLTSRLMRFFGRS